MAALLFLSLLSCLSPSAARAAPFGADLHGAEIDELLASGRRLKLSGQVLVGLGSVAALAATVLGPFAYLSSLPVEPLQNLTPSSQLNPLISGAIGVGAFTIAALGIGIPLMAEGDARHRRARALVGKASMRLAAAPLPGGGSASLILMW